MKNNQLFNGALLFFLFITGALLFSGIVNKTKGYAVDNKSLLSETLKEPFALTYIEFVELQKDTQNYTLIDLRSHEAYNIANITNSRNIPFEEILEKSNLKKFHKEKRLKIIYGHTQSESVLALLILKAKGIDNIKILPGDFEKIHQLMASELPSSYYFFNEEKSCWDYARMMGGNHAKKDNSKNSEIPQLPDAKPVKGGC